MSETKLIIAYEPTNEGSTSNGAFTALIELEQMQPIGLVSQTKVTMHVELSTGQRNPTSTEKAWVTDKLSQLLTTRERFDRSLDVDRSNK